MQTTLLRRPQPLGLSVAARRRCGGAKPRSAILASALTDTERASVATLRSSLKGPDPRAEALQLLKRAAAAPRSVPPEMVEGALGLLEEAGPAPGPTPSPEGIWRLVFSNGTKIRAFQYIPVDEDFRIDLGARYCALESSVGPLRFVISGQVEGWAPLGGRLAFQFTAVDVMLGGSKVWSTRPSTKPKTYTFFLVSPEVAAARSSQGGLALLRWERAL